VTSYELEPEVAGGLGPATEWGSRPNEIARLDYEFDDWLGDDLVTTTPAVLATARVRDAILAAGLTGVDFAPVIVSRSELFEELNGGELPEWTWLRPVGRPNHDDFWAEGRSDLTASGRALEVLRTFQLEHCIVTPVQRVESTRTAV
jgi:hypothetical protein